MTSYNVYRKRILALDGGDDIERWITVNGNHIPIYEGQSAHLAIGNWIASKKGHIEGEGYADSVKHYTSAQHRLAAKEYEKLGDYAFKKYQKGEYKDDEIYEKHEGYRRRQEFHENQQRAVGIKELQKKDNYADYSVPELSKEEISKIYKANFTKGGINVYELKPEIWKEIESTFTPEELNKEMEWNISGKQKFGTILKNTLRPDAHAISERIYDIGREWGVPPKKVYNAFVRMRKTA